MSACSGGFCRAPTPRHGRLPLPSRHGPARSAARGLRHDGRGPAARAEPEQRPKRWRRGRARPADGRRGTGDPVPVEQARGPARRGAARERPGARLPERKGEYRTAARREREGCGAGRGAGGTDEHGRPERARTPTASARRPPAGHVRGRTEGRSAAKGSEQDVGSECRIRRSSANLMTLTPFVGLQRRVMWPVRTQQAPGSARTGLLAWWPDKATPRSHLDCEARRLTDPCVPSRSRSP